MENTPKNDSTNQNELDLGLNSNEPVTPRKTVTEEPSLFNKFFKKKETVTNPFAERREPTFGTDKINTTVNPSDVVKSVATSMNNKPTDYNVNNGANPQRPTTTASTYSTVSDSHQETTAQAQNNDTVRMESENYADEPSENEKPAKVKLSIKNPENWKVMQKLPHKHRRLFIAIAAAVVILVALLMLKPRSETVEDFQVNSNGNAMPIEFQSLDPNKSSEYTETTNVNVNVVEPSQDMSAQIDNTQPNEQTAADTTSVNTVTTNIVPTADSTVNHEDNQTRLSTAEQTRLEKAREAHRKAEQQAQAAKLKAERQAKEKAGLPQQVQTKAQATVKDKTPAVNAKPAGTKAIAQQSKTTSGSSKTLTVPSGTSLFQVFRTNGLDIRDANAMTKARGANNVLSRFKANDKVQVAINSEGRVSTMRLSDGSVFTRQSDGTYKYSK